MSLAILLFIVSLTSWPIEAIRGQQQQQQQRFHSDETYESMLGGWSTIDRSRPVSSIGSIDNLDELAPYEKPCMMPSEGSYLEFRIRFKRHEGRSDIDLTNQKESDEFIRRRDYYRESMQRVIMFNNIVEEFTRQQKANGPYYYIDARDLYYADISDTELGFLRHTIERIFKLIDNNKPMLAYEAASRMNGDIPLLSAEGFRQAINILMVRLSERVDFEQINRWFAWPRYYKLMSAARYGEQQLVNRRQKMRSMSAMANQLAKLVAADGRSSSSSHSNWFTNWNSNNANNEQPTGSQFSDDDVVRYVSSLMVVPFVYRDFYNNIRYNAHGAVNRTHANLAINEQFKAFNIRNNRTHINTEEKDRRWRVFKRRMTLIRTLDESNIVAWIREFDTTTNPITIDEQQQKSTINAADLLMVTRFADLSDAEFIAYLNDDYSDLTSETDREFLQRSLPVMALTNELKWEIVVEIMTRRFQFHWTYDEITEFMDELVSYMGLPIGPRSMSVPSSKAQRMFDELQAKYSKQYTNDEVERVNRFDTFRRQLGQILVWHKKDEWELSGEQALNMFRLADVTWPELKMTIFGLCCLAGADTIWSNTPRASGRRGESGYAPPAQYNGLANYNSSISYLNSLRVCVHQPPMPTSRSIARQYDVVMRELYYYYLINFNRHHQNRTRMNQRYDIFRQNLQTLATLNCRHTANQYRTVEQLLAKEAHLFNDKIIDDIHLDSFVYFDPIENVQQQQQRQQQRQRQQHQQAHDDDYFRSTGTLPRGRADVSYRRDFFGSFADTPLMGNQHDQNEREYDRLQLEPGVLGYSNYPEQVPSSPFTPDLLNSNIFNVTTRYFAAQCRERFGNRHPDLVGDSDRPTSVFSNDPCALYQDGLTPWAQNLKPKPKDYDQVLASARCLPR